MLIIGLGHQAQHGKDTFAQTIYDAYRGVLDIRLASFADPLRAEVTQAAYDIWEEIAYPKGLFNPQEALRMLCYRHGVPFDPEAPVDQDYPWGKQRKLYQWWGTEFRRAQDPDYWVNQAEDHILQAEADGADTIIFRDMRFHNEFDLIGRLGGSRVKISRMGWESNVPQHISETELKDRVFDLHLGVADGQLDLLKALAVPVFQQLFVQRPPNRGLYPS
jgi:hypothetical protein